MDYLKLLPLLPVIAKYAGLIQTLTNMAPDIESMANDFESTVHKHQVTINKLEQLTPQMQAFVTEALPIIQTMK